MHSEVQVRPIGRVKSPIQDAVDDVWGRVRAEIHLDASRFAPDCLLGLEEFSHIEVVFLFDRVEPSGVTTGARHPRGRTNWPSVGIFGQRAKNRPNRLGVTTCRLVSVRDLVITVDELDAIDQTPVLDIKPYMKEFAARGPVHQPAWATELMANYWSS